MQSKKIKQQWEQAAIQSMDLHMRMIRKTSDKGYIYTFKILTPWHEEQDSNNNSNLNKYYILCIPKITYYNCTGRNNYIICRKQFALVEQLHMKPHLLEDI